MHQQINLYRYLPARSQNKLRYENVLWLYLLFFFLLMLYYSSVTWQNHVQTRKIVMLNVELARKKEELMQVTARVEAGNPTDLNAMIDRLQEQLATKANVTDFLTHQTIFSRYLIGLATAIVPGVWLTQISISKGGDVIELKGSSLQADAIQQFAEKLSHQPEFNGKIFEVSELTQAPNSQPSAKEPFHFLLRNQSTKGRQHAQ